MTEWGSWGGDDQADEPVVDLNGADEHKEEMCAECGTPLQDSEKLNWFDKCDDCARASADISSKLGDGEEKPGKLENRAGALYDKMNS